MASIITDSSSTMRSWTETCARQVRSRRATSASTWTVSRAFWQDVAAGTIADSDADLHGGEVEGEASSVLAHAVDLDGLPAAQRAWIDLVGRRHLVRTWVGVQRRERQARTLPGGVEGSV